MISAIQTEQEFDSFFDSLGFKRVSDDAGMSPSFQNADYVHKENKIIIELKVLEKEHFEEGGVIGSINAFILQPVSIDEQRTGQYKLSLPKQNREGKHDNIKEPLKRTLKKANKQLRETKRFYSNIGHFSGYVIFAQTGLSSLSPEITGQVLRKSMFKNYSEIDGAIICTPHFQTKNPFTLETNPECVSITKNWSQKHYDECFNLAEAWIRYFEKGGFSCT